MWKQSFIWIANELFAAFAEVRERHGADSLRRFERAVTGYLREWDARPPDARQRPKMRRQLDANHASVCTSTDNTAGRSRAIADHDSPPSGEA